ncbi:type IV pilus modification protein PilV [Psychrobacter sp. Pi2-52]|uniref:type IV pilus modification protein PilV n=1 Tax=Psychrobacter sp. Pi2-52 TaxID=2774133 RepID=UPI00191914AA|nr:type IV pilus modification protein PilV [Psychrobacter sp. Pi2-52]
MNIKQQGFGLIEVMVSLLILAIAVLGFAAMQGQAIKATDESLERTQSLVMMRNMGEKIRLNPTAITAYETAINTPVANAPSKSCGLYGTDTSVCTPAQLAAAEAYLYTQDMGNYGFTVNLRPCPSTGEENVTNIMYSWCLISAWGETTPTIGTDDDVDCLTSQATNDDNSITKGGIYHPGATCMFMEVT